MYVQYILVLVHTYLRTNLDAPDPCVVGGPHPVYARLIYIPAATHLTYDMCSDKSIFFYCRKPFTMRWRAAENAIGSPFPPRKKVSGLAQISGKVKTSALISFGPVIALPASFPFLRIGCVHMLWLCMGVFFGLRLISTFCTYGVRTRHRYICTYIHTTSLHILYDDR